MGSLLTRKAIIEAAHDLWCVFVNDRWDEIGRKRPHEWDLFRDEVGRLDDELAIAVMWRHIGRVEQAWGYDVGLVFHHMGLETDEEQQRVLYYLMMGCLGHGVGLWTDHGEVLDRAREALGRPFDPVPIHCEFDEFTLLGEETYPGPHDQKDADGTT